MRRVSVSDMMMRILICHDCRSTEELPHFEGDSRNDYTLEYATQKHRFPNGEQHKGKLFRDIKVKHWESEDIRKDLLKRIWATQGFTGLEPWVYSSVNTLKEDAMDCWSKRGRPQRCGDFHSEKKKLVPPSQNERGDAGLGKYKASPGQTRYLCDYCVCRMQVENEINEKRDV
jgi:hypothetical protein